MLYDDANTAPYLPCHNHQYSPEALLNDSGTIVERYDYYAYGLPVIHIIHIIHTATVPGGGAFVMLCSCFLTGVLTGGYGSLINKEILNRVRAGLSDSIMSKMCIMPICL